MAFDRRETALLLVGDFLILAASLWAALFLRNLSIPQFGYFKTNFVPFLPIFFISIAVFYGAGLYEKQTRPIRRVMGTRILGAQAATVAIAAILFFVLPLSIAPKTILVLYLVVSIVAESVWRFYRMNCEIAEGKRTPAFLIGSGSAVSELFDEVNNNNRYLIRFVNHTETKNLSKGAISDTVVTAIKNNISIIVVDASDPLVVSDLPMLYDHMVNGITFLEFSSFYEEIFDRVPIRHLNAGQLLESLPKHRAIYDAMKRLFDLFLAVIGSIIAAPFVFIAILSLYLSGGSPFIPHDRIGRGGRTFRVWKLRSMLSNDHGDPELQKKNRVTMLGRILRKTRVDELPQLLNILAGDLSFIGPRPELPKIAEVYDKEIPQYRMRHLITPGLSGWAQIHDADPPKGGADVVRTWRKLSFDLYYLKHRSIGLDLAIAVKTVRALLSFSGS